MALKDLVSTIKKFNSTAGKISISFTLIFTFVFGGVLMLYSQGHTLADKADTSVTVLNTPPSWTVDAEEGAESSLTNPTNSGSNVTWTGTATDSNGQDFFLLICKTSAAPTANNGGSAPTCDGGASNQWAVSTSTASGSEATATYATSESDTNQSNDWWAFVCDSPSSDAKCNGTSKQGTTTTASPFVINYRPTFTVFDDDTPADPGATVTWTSTATDSAKNTDQTYNVQLFVCKANDFTGSACGAGGAWCSSTAVASDPTCNAAMDDPMTDGTHESYGFVIDAHTHAASGGSQGTDSVLDINNVTPAVGAASISVLDTDEVGSLALTTAEGETTGFKVKFTVTDANSCENQAAGDEIASTLINVYRSGVGVANCQDDLHHDTNDCYPADAETQVPGTWTYSCSQDAGTCSGTSDNSVDWTCTFPLWFNADATEGAVGDSQFPSENWVASVKPTDDDAAAPASFTESSTGNELLKFLAYDVSETAISYGSLEAGQNTGATNQTTTTRAVGNTGVDEDLNGTEMCPGFDPLDPGGDNTYGCNQDPSDTIFSTSQKYDTASFDYAVAGNPLPEATPDTVAINVPKTTDETAPASALTHWGIEVPSTITIAGSYTGENTILGVESAVANW